MDESEEIGAGVMYSEIDMIGVVVARTTLTTHHHAYIQNGAGEIHLKELYEELSTIPGVRVDKNALDRLQRQFKYMDRNGDGSVSFPEFHKAATIALSRGNFDGCSFISFVVIIAKSSPCMCLCISYGKSQTSRH